jgi:hypothetical protein
MFRQFVFKNENYLYDLIKESGKRYQEEWRIKEQYERRLEGSDMCQRYFSSYYMFIKLNSITETYIVEWCLVRK